MLKALSITGSGSHRSVAGRRGRGLARGVALAAAAFLALAAGAATACARSTDKAPARVGAAVQQAGWENRGHRLRLQRVVPRAHHPRAHHPRAHHPRAHHPRTHHHKFHKRQTFHGQGHKKLHHKGRRHYGAACRPVKVVGWHHGRRALFGQVLCVNRFGQRSYMRGSRYLIRYLHH